MTIKSSDNDKYLVVGGDDIYNLYMEKVQIMHGGKNKYQGWFSIGEVTSNQKIRVNNCGPPVKSYSSILWDKILEEQRK